VKKNTIVTGTVVNYSDCQNSTMLPLHSNLVSVGYLGCYRSKSHPQTANGGKPGNIKFVSSGFNVGSQDKTAKKGKDNRGRCRSVLDRWAMES
jgi:hypothetical protein